VKLQRLRPGRYLTIDGRFLIERDSGSTDEWDVPSEPAWFVYGDGQNFNDVGPPDALFEGATLRDCLTWVRNR